MDPLMQEVQKAAAAIRRGVEALAQIEKSAQYADAVETIRLDKLAGMYEDLVFVDLVEATISGQL